MAVTLNTKIGLDVSDVVTATQKYAASLGIQISSIDQLAIKNLEFNRSGKILRAEIELQIDAYKRLSLEVGRAVKSTPDSARIKAAGQPDLRITHGNILGKSTTPIDLDQVRKGTEAITATNRIRAQFPVPERASVEQIAKYEAAINSVGNALARGKISSARFKEIFDAASKGKPFAALNLNEQEAKMVGSLKNIQSAFKETAGVGNRFHLGLKNAFRITEALILKDIIGAIIRQLTEGVRASLQFQVQISQIRTLSESGSATFNEWADSIKRVSDELGLPIADTATAAYQALSNQVTKGKVQTEAFLKTAGELSRVGVAKVSDTVDLLSATFNSYNISVHRAEETSAKFFKAVDLGRFTIADLAQNFGRVSAPAAAIGVSYEEVLAAMATLTNQGVKADDAMTQLNNIFLKLQKPTEAMQSLLEGMGFATGQIAIETLGLSGFLKQLEVQIKGDTRALSELGGEMRAIRGLIGLTTRGKGEDFRENLEKIRGGKVIDDFEKAKTIRGESSGDKLIKEFEKVKNFFINDLGRTISDVLQNINEGIGGFANAVKKLTGFIIGAGEAWVVYKAATIAATIANVAAEVGIVSLTTAVGRLALAWGPLIVGAAGIGYLVAVQEEAVKTSEAMQKIVDAREGKKDPLTADKEFQKNQLELSKAFDDKIKAQAQRELDIQALAFKASNKHLTELKIRGQETSQALQLAFKATADVIEESIRNAAQAMSHARSEIEKSAKDIVGINATVKGLIIDLRKDFASPDQQFDIRDTEIKDLQAEIQRLSESGKEEDLQEARTLGKQLLSLVKEDAKERLQVRVDVEKRRRQQTGSFDTSPIRVHTLEQENRIREFGEWLVGINKKITEQQQKQVDVNKEQIDIDTKRKRELEQAVKNIDKLTPTNVAGDIKPEFRDKTGGFDQKAFATQYDKVVAQLNNLVKTDAERAELSVALEAKKKQLIAEQNELINIQFIKAQQLRIVQERDKNIDEFRKLGDTRIGIRGELEAMGKDLKGTIEILGAFVAQAKSDDSLKTIGAGADPVRRLGLQIVSALAQTANESQPFFHLSPTERAERARENEPKLRALLDYETRLQKQRDKIFARDEKGNLTGTAADLEEFGKLIVGAGNQMKTVVRAFTGAQDPTDFNLGKGPTVGETTKALTEQLKSVSQAFEKEKAAQRQQDAMRTALEENRIALGRQTDATNPNTEATKKLTQSLEFWVSNLTAAAATAAHTKQQTNLPPRDVVFGPGFHSGGLIKGPHGNDNLHIMAEAGEFVMSRLATKKWLPQLIAMNSGVTAPRMPGKYHEGGIVQTNVGDVNITMTGSPSPEKTVRAMGNALKRQIRRGNLQLPYKKA